MFQGRPSAVRPPARTASSIVCVPSPWPRHLELDRVRVPENDRLTGLYGDEGADADSGGFAAVQRGLNIARVHTAARAVGVARAALEDTWALGISAGARAVRPSDR